MKFVNRENNINHIFSLEKESRIGILKINNTIKNTVDHPVFLDIKALYDWIESENLIGLIITGNKRHFSNGADLNAIFEKSENIQLLADEIRQAHKILEAIMMLNIPVAAAIRGVCFGAGLELAMCCHFRICSRNAMLALPESSAGIMPGFMGTLMLQRYIGFSKACEMIFTGNIISLDAALNTGLVDNIVDDAELLSFTLSYLRKLTKNRTDKQIHSIMQSMNNARISLLQDAAAGETDLFCSLVQEIKNK